MNKNIPRSSILWDKICRIVEGKRQHRYLSERNCDFKWMFGMFLKLRFCRPARHGLWFHEESSSTMGYVFSTTEEKQQESCVMCTHTLAHALMYTHTLDFTETNPESLFLIAEVYLFLQPSNLVHEQWSFFCLLRLAGLLFELLTTHQGCQHMVSSKFYQTIWAI